MSYPIFALSEVYSSSLIKEWSRCSRRRWVGLIRDAVDQVLKISAARKGFFCGVGESTTAELDPYLQSNNVVRMIAQMRLSYIAASCILSFELTIMSMMMRSRMEPIPTVIEMMVRTDGGVALRVEEPSLE